MKKLSVYVGGSAHDGNALDRLSEKRVGHRLHAEGFNYLLPLHHFTEAAVHLRFERIYGCDLFLWHPEGGEEIDSVPPEIGRALESKTPVFYGAEGFKDLIRHYGKHSTPDRAVDALQAMLNNGTPSIRSQINAEMREYRKDNPDWTTSAVVFLPQWLYTAIKGLYQASTDLALVKRKEVLLMGYTVLPYIGDKIIVRRAVPSVVEGCLAVGRGGQHSDSHGEEGDGTCVWCGLGLMLVPEETE